MNETAAPHRLGAALSYARRYALFALVGIAGEDDLDAPDLAVEPNPSVVQPSVAPGPSTRKQRKGVVHSPRGSDLTGEASTALRDRLVGEMVELSTTDDLALWAHRRLAAKNTLSGDDARVVEAAYQSRLDAMNGEAGAEQVGDATPVATAAVAEKGAGDIPDLRGQQLPSAPSVTPLRKEVRRRDKAHLAFVAAQPCLVCQRSPCDAHHLKFAQPRALGRKVSDEFTVPLCRDHHRDLHRHGYEQAWWKNASIEPVQAARDLWNATHRKATIGGREVATVVEQAPPIR